MSKLQDYPYLSSISEDDKVLIVRNNGQGLAKISDLPIKGDIPEQLRQEMNAVFNKKFGTAKTYPPKDWPEDVNLMGVLKEKTVSGSVAYFEDGADDVPCKNVVVTIPATPSGVSEVVEKQAGRNLIDNGSSAWEQGNINMNGENATGTGTRTIGYFELKGGATITVSGIVAPSTNSDFRIFYYDKDKNFLSYRNYSVSYIVPYDVCYIRIRNISIADISALQIEYGSTATDYKPYTAPTIYTASLGRTIYGGTTDIVNGVGTDNCTRIKFSDLNWTYYTSGTNPIFYAGNVPSMKIYARTEMPNVAIDGYTTRTAHSRSYLSTNMANMECSAIENAQTITFRNDSYTSVSSMLAALGDEYIGYEITTSTDFTFDGQEINTRLGYNAFWSDEGNTEVTYRSNGDAETPIVPTLVTKSIDSNGTYRAEDDDADGYSEVTVDIPTPTPPVLEEKTVTSNGTYIAEDDNVDGYSEVTVNVPSPDLEAKAITANGTYVAQDDNLDGYSSVTVNVQRATLGTKNITTNGIYSASSDSVDGYSTVSVNVQAANLDAKEITQNGTYIPQDDDLDGYSAVSVNVAGPTLITKSVTENGTYNASSDSADGYSEVSVNVPTHGDLLNLLKNNSMSNKITVSDEVIKTDSTDIRQYTFYKAWITYINLQNVKTIGEYAFYTGNGSNGTRTQIILPKCESIGAYAFKDFSRSYDAINQLDLSNVQTIGEYAFNRAKIQVKIVLPKCISIGNNAFQETGAGGYGLEAPLLETIGNNVFSSTYFSVDIELPSIKTIGNNAFAHTTSTNFTIGESCTSIGNTIFGSGGVTNLYVLADTPPTLGSNFKNTNTGVQHIYVPEDSVDLYKAANVWSNYASIIEAIQN